MIAKPTALIIELAPSRNSLLSKLLGELGYPLVMSASSHSDALERMQLVAFDVIFVEVAGADDPGYAFVRDVRFGAVETARTPIIVMSAESQRAAVARARDCGASGFLTRPFSLSAVALQLARVPNDPRTFIRADTFIGPDRRRCNDPSYDGPERRCAAGADAYVLD